MSWGKNLKTLYTMWEETGVQPKALLNRPQLANVWDYPYTIWAELSGSRSYTASGRAEIPFSEVYLYAKSLDYSNSEVYGLFKDVNHIDKSWLSEVSKQAAQEAKSKSKPA